MIDVVALPLEEALQKLHQTGVDVEVLKTYTTKPTAVTENWRVVRQTEKNGKTLLVAAQECEGLVP